MSAIVETLADPAADIPIAEYKRVLERAVADPEYRQRLLDDPGAAAAEYGFTWNPAFIGPMVAPDYLEYLKAHGEGELPPIVKAWRARVAEKLRARDAMTHSAFPNNPIYRQWRERQKARLTLELGPPRAQSIIHAPMCLELNKGCSVGCWFCGIAAPKLSDIWPYTDDNAALWRGVLQTMKDIVGPSARWGFCYWATDPLDNPDYERFVVDYHEILGTFPQTTTALALRDPARTRALLALAASRGCNINRFSIVTLKKFLDVHKEFTAEELVDVECIPQNTESTLKMARAGKALENAERVSRSKGKDVVAEETGTIACVSGFLFNMVDRSVKIVTPCGTRERWPLGYQVLEEQVFRDLDDLTSLIHRMIESNMAISAKQLPRLSWAPWLKHEPLDDGVAVSSTCAQLCFRHPNVAWLHAVARLLADGGLGADDIALLCLYGQGVPIEQTIALLENMFAQGVLDEEPTGVALPPAPARPDAAPALAYAALFDAEPAPSASPASTYLSLFAPSPSGALTQSEASRAYHARTRQPSDDILWISRMRPPQPTGHLREGLARLGISPRGVLHVGAHWGLELEAYIAAGFGRIVFFEASPLALPHLETHVAFWNEWLEVFTETWSLPRRPRIEIVKKAVSDRCGSASMHAAELEMLSSLLPPAADWIRVQRVVEVETGTLDALLAERGMPAADFNVLNVDVQGAELKVLAGASETLRNVEAVIIELDENPRYVGGATAGEVDEALRALGFTQATKTDWGHGVADATYVRRR